MAFADESLLDSVRKSADRICSRLHVKFEAVCEVQQILIVEA